MTEKTSRATIDEVAKFLFQAPHSAISGVIKGFFGDCLKGLKLALAPNEYIHGFSRKHPDLVLLALNSAGEVEICFHIEIQTRAQSNIGFRMYDYGSIIGRFLSSDGEQVIMFPHQAVLYIKSNRVISSEHCVKINLPDGQKMEYRADAFHLAEHGIDDLVSSGMYLLVPLRLVLFEQRLKAANMADEAIKTRVHEDFLKETKEIIRTINQLYMEGTINEEIKNIMISATCEIFGQMDQKYIHSSVMIGEVFGMIRNISQMMREEGRAEGRDEGRVEGRVEGRNEGRVEGRNEGRVEGKTEIARNLLAKGFDIETIIEVTGLDRKTIQS